MDDRLLLTGSWQVDTDLELRKFNSMKAGHAYHLPQYYKSLLGKRILQVHAYVPLHLHYSTLRSLSFLFHSVICFFLVPPQATNFHVISYFL